MTARPSIGPLTPHLFRPDRARPVRAKRQHLLAATRVVPHAHPWGQVAISTTGVVRVTMPHGTTIVPPSRALWIPPGVEHAVTVVEDADLLTLYVASGRRGSGLAASAAETARWRQCRVLDASRLLLALALELAARPDAARAAGAARHRLARGKTSAPPVRSDARRSFAARLARRLGRRRRRQRTHDRAALSQRARHDLRSLARAGPARPR